MKTLKDFQKEVAIKYRLGNELVNGHLAKYFNEASIEFAKYHVELALKSASENVTMNLEYPEPYQDSNEKELTFTSAEEISRGGEYGHVEVDIDSILNAYPLNQII